MTRKLTCECGEILTAQDDEELVRQGRQHIKLEHPDMPISDGMIRDMVKTKAKDA